ncbi:hypothetical protein AMTRI_Chr10g226880 [Amborella trichopoda]
MVSDIFSTILRALCSLFMMFLFFKLVEFVVKVWWIPLTVTKFMEKQGITGPPYKFLHGNNKEVRLMIMDVFLCWLGTRPQLVVTEPELIREIINNKKGDFQKPKKNPIVKRLLGDGLVLADGEKWVRHRKLANKAFNGESFRVTPLFFSLSLYRGAGVARDEIEAKMLDQQITRSIRKMIEAREERVRNGDANGYGVDFFGMLLQSPVNSNISLQDIVDECKTFYFAGHVSSSALLTWTVVLLAMHPEWQERARKEVIQVLGSDTPSFDGLAQLKIMNMIINESLRLYPPGQLLNRISTRKLRVGKFTIPSGMELVVPILAVHHDPSQWREDVSLFKPDRFAHGVTSAASTQVSFIPFGHGPRICAGLNFATLEAKLALSMILRRYTFTLSLSYQHAPVSRITLVPQQGAQIIIHSL